MAAAPRPPGVLLLVVAAGLGVGTRATMTTTAHAAAGGGRASYLRPASDLTSNCFDFPANNFDRERSIRGVYRRSPHLLLETGQGAIDFTLYDYPGGNPWSLREELERGGAGEGTGAGKGKPVVLIWGMYTCPSFEGMGDDPPLPPWDMSGYWDEYELVESYQNRVTFVHLYGPEPHPKTPGTNFDHGVPVNNYWSTEKQPTTYQERLDMVDRIRDVLHPKEVILPDFLPGNPYSDLIQPVWCSYGLGARPATVVAPDGRVLYQQEWLHTGRLARELDMFLNANRDASGRDGEDDKTSSSSNKRQHE